MHSKSPPSKKNPSQDFTVRRTHSFQSNLKLSPVKTSPTKSLPQKRYEKYCCGHITQSLYTEFLSDLQKVTKTINCHISQSFELKTVFSSIISAVKQTVDQLLHLQNSFSADSAEVSINTEQKSDSHIMLTNRVLKFASTPKNCKYDELIIIQKKEKKGLNLNCSYSNSKSNTANEKIRWKTESSDQGSAKTSQVILFQSLLEDIEYPESGIRSVEESWTNFQEHKEFGRKLLEPCFSCQEYRKTGSGLLEISICDRILITPTNKTHDILNLKEQELHMRERLLKKNKLDLENMVARIKQQIEAYNEELEIREGYLEGEKLKMTIKEIQISQKLRELNEIKEKLISSKCELEDIPEIFQKIQSYFELIRRILGQALSLKHKFEEIFTQSLNIFRNLEKQEELIDKAVNTRDADFEEKINLYQESFEYERNENLGVMEICEMRKELEEKLKILQDKEIEISLAKKEIDEANEENLKTLMILKSVKLELTNQKLKSEKILNRKLEKLKKLKNHLISAVNIG